MDFGEEVDLTHTFLGLTFDTADFARDRPPHRPRTLA